jgi:hypothetical protein
VVAERSRKSDFPPPSLSNRAPLLLSLRLKSEELKTEQSKIETDECRGGGVE